MINIVYLLITRALIKVAYVTISMRYMTRYQINVSLYYVANIHKRLF